MFLHFLRDERGNTAVEYGLIVAVLSLAIAVGAGAAMDEIETEYTDVNSRFNQAFQ